MSGEAELRALSLARLLHADCTHLLELYKERESFSFEPPDMEFCSPFPAPDLPSEEQMRHLCSALRRCLRMLERAIQMETEHQEGEYELKRNGVRARLEYLLHATVQLLEGNAQADVVEDVWETEELDGGFHMKMWTYRVLLELVAWTRFATRALHVLHAKTEKQEL